MAALMHQSRSKLESACRIVLPPRTFACSRYDFGAVEGPDRLQGPYSMWASAPQDRPDLLGHMSESLSAEVAEHTQARWVRAVPAFAALSREFAVEIALALGTKSFSPDEVRLAHFSNMGCSVCAVCG